MVAYVRVRASSHISVHFGFFKKQKKINSMFMYLKVQRGEAILEKDSLLFSFIPISSNADALLVTQNHLVD